MRLAKFFALMVVLAGCPICPDGEWLVIDGSTNVKPNESVQFVFRYGDDTYSSPAQCDGHWSVDDVKGGTETTGWVSPCGKYTAPASPPSKDVVISAMTYAKDTCADCCPSAWIDVCITAR